jgi:hypothetical protein
MLDGPLKRRCGKELYAARLIDVYRSAAQRLVGRPDQGRHGPGQSDDNGVHRSSCHRPTASLRSPDVADVVAVLTVFRTFSCGTTADMLMLANSRPKASGMLSSRKTLTSVQGSFTAAALGTGSFVFEIVARLVYTVHTPPGRQCQLLHIQVRGSPPDEHARPVRWPLCRSRADRVTGQSQD